jgi:hypothetical protein
MPFNLRDEQELAGAATKLDSRPTVRLDGAAVATIASA